MGASDCKWQKWNLTAVQSAPVLNCIYSFSGLDKIGQMYGLQGVATAGPLNLFDGNIYIEDQAFRDDCNFAAWNFCTLRPTKHISL
jgi:hypothetical protein